MRRRSRQKSLLIGAASAVTVALVLAPAALTVAGDTIVTAAGNGTRGISGDGSQATEAALDRPRSVFATADGGFVWAQPWTNTVRKIGPDGLVTKIAGTGSAGYSGDGGPAAAAELNFVHSAAPTTDGGYLLADTLNATIRKVSANGVITTVAGTGVAGYSGDGGPATSAEINNPRGVVALSDGSFLIPDSNNHRVRRVSPSGTITTVAGTGVQGFSGDGGQATAAELSIPFGVAPTADGGLLIVDVGNQRIRKVAANGTITTVAGNGTPGYSGDGGPATAASLFNPHNVVALSDGSFLIADPSNLRVRKVDFGGTIQTFIGTGVAGFSGDGGPAAQAQVAYPKAVALTTSGDILIADEQNDRIRFVGTPVSPASVSSPTVSGQATEGQTLNGSAGGWSGTGPTFTYQWQRCNAAGSACTSIAGAVAKTYLLTQVDVASTIRIAVTGSNVAGSSSATSAPTAGVAAAGQPPANVVPPTVSGVARDGETLTADEGTWTGTPPLSYAYQWRRCNASGGACADIAGSTAKIRVVSSADVGSTIRVVVTASNSAGSRYAASVQADSPRSYWRMGDGGGTLVDREAIANGQYVGAPQQGVPGLLTGDPDAAVTLDGTSQYLEIPGDPAWTPAGGFSIEVVVRPSALPANRTIWAAQGLFTGWWLNTGPTGELRIFVGDGSAWRYNAAGPVLQPGQTHHVVATYDGSFARLYIDGAPVSTGPAVTMATNAGANPMRLGSASSFVGQHWPGTLDEASFYPGALSAAQVQAHHAVSSTGSSGTSAPSAVVAPAPPANTSPPTISGTAQVGQTLTAGSGSWSGTQPISYAYQWRRCDSSGNGCADIAGATASTYTLTAAEVGATIRAQVTATNAAGSASASSAQTQLVVAAATSPTNTSSPTISGPAQQGQTLTASQGTWSGSQPLSYTYQWRRCNSSGGACTDVAAATSTSFTLTSADVGSTIRVAVTASNVAGSATAASAPSAVVSSAPSSTTLTFSVLATGDDGDVKSNNMGTGGPYPPATAPAAFTSGTTFAVRRSGPAFGGYEIRAGLLRFDTSSIPDGATILSAKLRVAVTSTTSANARSLVAEWYPGSSWPIDAADYSGTAASTAYAGIPILSLLVNAQNNLALQNVSSISATGYSGLRLHVSGGEPTGENAVWFAALEHTSLPEPQLEVTYSYTPTPPVNTSSPTISGPAQQGQTLTASQGTWSGSQPLSYTYQWRRCNSSGGACTDVAAATSTSFTLTSADVGSTIRVAVTASNVAGSATAASAPSAVVSSAPSSTTLTFSVLATGDDGDVKSNNMGTGGPYPPATAPAAFTSGTTFAVRRSGPAFGGYEIRAGLLRFDTSSIPDGATILSAKLRVAVTSTTSANARSLVAEWYPGSSWPIDAADYSGTAASTAYAGIPILSLLVNAQNNLALQNVSSISATGYSGLRLHVSGGEPTGENAVWFAALEHTSLPEPQLEVTYSLP